MATDRKKPSNSSDRKPKNRRNQGIHRRKNSQTSAWIYGLHAVEAVLANPKRHINRLVMTANLAKTLPSDPAVKPEIMSPQELDSLLPEGSVHQGLAVQAEPLSPPALDQVLTDETNRTAPPLIFLDQVSDPHNVGAILRSAAAFGAAALIVQDRHAPPITGTLAKTASGAVEHVPIIRVTNLSRALEVVERSGYFRIGLAGEAIETLSSYSIPNKVALVLGAEGPGLRRLTREKCDVLLRLPTQEPISSLNVSNAAAVALFALTAKA